LIKEVAAMSDAQTGVKLGHKVPDFTLTTYDPVQDDFGTVSLAGQMAGNRWTILFFYPADFTFV
jgi:NADH-dependent peroxiredoxin subunit C